MSTSVNKSFSSRLLFENLLEIVNSHSEFKLLVTGHSMRPFLRHERDSVFLSRCDDFHDLSRGDIVLIQYPEEKMSKYVLHRVIKTSSCGFVMNGDAQHWSEFITFDRVLAVVKAIERKGKYIPCDNKYYRLFSNIWMSLLPIRWPITKVMNLKRRFLQVLNRLHN